MRHRRRRTRLNRCGPPQISRRPPRRAPRILFDPKPFDVGYVADIVEQFSMHVLDLIHDDTPAADGDEGAAA